MSARDTITAPDPALRYLEGMRAAMEFGALAASAPLLYGGPRGDGHDVLVLPGMGGNDTSTALLRSYLADIGYRSHGWGLGRNLGLRQIGGLDALFERVHAIRQKRTGGTSASGALTVIGWSLGGVFARQMVRAEPSLFRQVITMGSPINGDPRATAPWRIVERSINRAANQSGGNPRAVPRIDPAIVDGYIKRNGPPPPGVPATAIFSRSDGVSRGK